MPSSAYYRKQAELFARLALANINDPARMDRYNALALEYLDKADAAKLTGPMPPGALSQHRRPDVDRD